MTTERERDFADGRPTSRATWHEAANGLLGAVVARWQTSVTCDEDDDCPDGLGAGFQRVPRPACRWWSERPPVSAGHAGQLRR
jgi:hypothetical protein